jgi:hypothetical protein
MKLIERQITIMIIIIIIRFNSIIMIIIIEYLITEEVIHGGARINKGDHIDLC